jgi:hypothetical protein
MLKEPTDAFVMSFEGDISSIQKRILFYTQFQYTATILTINTTTYPTIDLPSPRSQF